MAAALQSLGTAELFDQDTVVQRVLRMSEHLSERSLAMRVVGATRIPATIEDIVPEENTTRLVVRFRPDFVRAGFSDTETVRTDRTDGALGDEVVRLWSGLEGHHVIIYKTCEDTGNPERPKVRVAPYVEVID